MAKKSTAAKVRKYITDNPDATTDEVVKTFKITKAYFYVLRSNVKKQNNEAAFDQIAQELKPYLNKPGPKVGPFVANLNGIHDVTVDKWMTSSFNRSAKPMPAPVEDIVNHPTHYKTGGIETIDFIEAKGLNYRLGNVVKYITRADHKGERKENLLKARWYLDREIAKSV